LTPAFTGGGFCLSDVANFARRWHFVPVMADVQKLAGGVVHALPSDLEEAIIRDAAALATWRDITPVARNEWICWVRSAKKAETRQKRIDWGRENLRDGKRRPCCWPGCPHR
jgi:hypothetical protein